MSNTTGYNFTSEDEIQPQTIEWGRVGDRIAGIFIEARSGIKTKFGVNTIYEIEAAQGAFHGEKTGEEVVLNVGEVWSVWGRGQIFDKQMKNMKSGERLELVFVESKPSSKGNDAKIIKVRTRHEIDEAWVAKKQESGDWIL